MMLSIVGICLRALLLFIAAVVLGLSVTLARQQAIGSVPPETGFGTFLGAAGFFASAFGMMALWFDQIQGRMLMVLDLVVSLFYLAGAIALTVAMKTVLSCNAADDASLYSRVANKILSGGCIHDGKDLACPHAASPSGTDFTASRCQMAQADYVFEYAGFVFGLFMVSMGYLLHRRGRGGTPAPTSAYHQG